MAAMAATVAAGISRAATAALARQERSLSVEPFIIQEPFLTWIARSQGTALSAEMEAPAGPVEQERSQGFPEMAAQAHPGRARPSTARPILRPPVRPFPAMPPMAEPAGPQARNQAEMVLPAK